MGSEIKFRIDIRFRHLRFLNTKYPILIWDSCRMPHSKAFKCDPEHPDYEGIKYLADYLGYGLVNACEAPPGENQEGMQAFVDNALFY